MKLTDFGIAKAATKASTTEKGALRGKLMYMSPEQAWGRPIDHRSDLFSLGIVLYELITDQRPFLGSSDMSLLDKVRRGTVSPPSSLNPEIPARLEKLVLKALERDPVDRHRDAGAMHQELESLLQEPGHAVAAADVARFVRILFRPGRARRGGGAGRARDRSTRNLAKWWAATSAPPTWPYCSFWAGDIGWCKQGIYRPVRTVVLPDPAGAGGGSRWRGQG